MESSPVFTFMRGDKAKKGLFAFEHLVEARALHLHRVTLGNRLLSVAFLTAAVLQL